MNGLPERNDRYKVLKPNAYLTEGRRGTNNLWFDSAMTFQNWRVDRNHRLLLLHYRPSVLGLPLGRVTQGYFRKTHWSLSFPILFTCPYHRNLCNRTNADNNASSHSFEALNSIILFYWSFNIPINWTGVISRLRSKVKVIAYVYILSISPCHSTDLDQTWWWFHT